MTDKMIFIPVLVQIALTLYLYAILLQTKLAAVANKDFDKSRVMLHDDAWPDSVIKINNNIRSQYEIPVLFFVIMLVIWATGTITNFHHIVAWLFVLSRMAHTAIHTGVNTQPRRRQTFTAGYILTIVLLFSAMITLFT